MKIGVVIQGPIISEGRTYDSLKSRRFDSSDCIQRQYQEATMLDCEVVISTWVGETLNQLSNIPKADIILNSPLSYSFFSNIRNDYANNKYKQFTSLLSGTTALKERNCTHIIKVRSDLDINLPKLINLITSMKIEIEPRKIAVPLLYSKKPDMFYDPYFVALTNEMVELCKIIVKNKELYASVHQDVFYKWALNVRGSYPKLNDIFTIYRRNESITAPQLQFISEAWLKSFSVLPKSLWENQVWRGEKIMASELKDNYYFFEDFETGRNEVTNVFSNKLTAELSLNIIQAMTYFVTSRFSNLLKRVQLMARRFIEK